MSAPKWHALWIGDGYNPRVVGAARIASGAYAIRGAKDHVVRYVGESSRGTLWKTMLRHFQAPDSFASVRETGVFTGDPRKYEVALHVTSRGHRPRAPASGASESKRLRDLKRRGVAHTTTADQKAMAAQARWIARLRPTKNRDDGLAGGDPAEEYREHLRKQEAEDEARPFFDNPAPPTGTLKFLGKLTEITWKGKALRWSLREAPDLGYDKEGPGGRLFIVYTGRIVRSSTPAEIRDYRRMHWGQRGRGVVREGRIAVGPFVELGAAKSITYSTTKGLDRELVDYVHPFGEGAPAAGFVPPRLVEHECTGGCGPRCAARGSISLTGGSYYVTTRGIVG